jgi:pyruvate,orthophosphate dikinase
MSSHHRHHHHHHHQHDAEHPDVSAEREPPEIPSSLGVDPSTAMPSVPPALIPTAAALGPRPPVAPAHAEATAALPPEVYLIGCGTDAASAAQATVQTMGFKAWNLLRMAQMSLPVPPAFVLGTHYCVDPAARELASSPDLWQAGLRALERATGLALGSARQPLLLSVRSGAPVSMPGMMETILNVGLCDATVGGLLRHTGNPRLVWDAYRRLVATYGEVVAGLPAQLFDEASTALVGVHDERDLDFAELRELTHRLLDVYAQSAGRPFPQEPRLQLAGAIGAVFASWQSPKACEYRRLNRIPDAIGTAVTVQSMVFGNAGGKSGAGVGFTRDPATGEPALWVDFLFNAQGEDVVSGRRSAHGHDELAAVLPAVWQALVDAASDLEHAFADMQDFEFTVQEGRLFMLQTRAGKRTPQAAARIALDMLDEGLVAADVARERTAGLDREALARPRVVTPNGTALVPLARAASASSGVAIGEIALDEARAVTRHGAGVPVLLVRRDAETSDIAALESATGLLTQRGARTSHAAVVARQLGRVCLVGCTELQIDEAARTIKIGDTTLCEGDLLTLDGNEGALYAGAVQTEIEYPGELLARLESLRQRG